MIGSRPAAFLSASTPLTRVFSPPSRRGAAYPAVGAALCLLIAAALLARGLYLGVSFAAFISYALAAILSLCAAALAYWTWACLTLRYELGGGSLVIRWGVTRHRIPATLIERAVRGRAGVAPALRGCDLPALHVGSADLPRIGRVRFVSLHRSAAELLYLVGPRAAYAISVGQPKAFIEALRDEQERENPLDDVRIEGAPLLLDAEWPRSSGGWAIAAALAFAVLASGIVFSRYAGFPDQIMLTFPAGDRVGDRTALLGIPAVAWLLMLANGVLAIRLLRRRPPAAFTLLCGLAFLEALLVVAAMTAVS